MPNTNSKVVFITQLEPVSIVSSVIKLTNAILPAQSIKVPKLLFIIINPKFR